MSSDKQPHTDKDYSFESVPLYARKNFWSMFFVLLIIIAIAAQQQTEGVQIGASVYEERGLLSL